MDLVMERWKEEFLEMADIPLPHSLHVNILTIIAVKFKKYIFK